jgi:hypothetical protein
MIYALGNSIIEEPSDDNFPFPECIFFCPVRSMDGGGGASTSGGTFLTFSPLFSLQ